MKKQIIGMISSYPSLNPSNADWLWNQTPEPFGKWGNIEMLSRHSKPDFLLLYNFNFHPYQPKLSPLDRLWKKRQNTPPDMTSLLRGVSQEKTIFLLREPPLKEIVNKNIIDYQEAGKYCNYISGPDDFAPHPNYMPAIWYVGNSFRELDEMSAPEKVKNCCWITSGISRSANHRHRLQFLQLLQNSGYDFDLYGRDLPKWAKTAGTLNNKWYGLAPYYYNLSIENYADNDWYVSEKLWDALLCWCLPIYYGGNAADKLLPPGSFLRLPSLDHQGLEYIKEVTATPDLWYNAKEAIAEARQIILHKLNLLAWLNDYVKKWE